MTKREARVVTDAQAHLRDIITAALIASCAAEDVEELPDGSIQVDMTSTMACYVRLTVTIQDPSAGK